MAQVQITKTNNNITRVTIDNTSYYFNKDVLLSNSGNAIYIKNEMIDLSIDYEDIVDKLGSSTASEYLTTILDLNYFKKGGGGVLDGDPYIELALSDMTSDLVVGTGVAYFRAPFAFTITGVRASVFTAPTGSALQVDINKNGSTIMTTEVTIDATEKTSTTAAVPAVFNDTTIANDDEISFDITQIGSTIAGAGLIMKIYYTI